MPPSAKTDETVLATIVAVGPQSNVGHAIGYKIFVSPYAGLKTIVGGRSLRIVEAKEVLAVVKE